MAENRANTILAKPRSPSLGRLAVLSLFLCSINSAKGSDWLGWGLRVQNNKTKRPMRAYVHTCIRAYAYSSIVNRHHQPRKREDVWTSGKKTSTSKQERSRRRKRSRTHLFAKLDQGSFPVHEKELQKPGIPSRSLHPNSYTKPVWARGRTAGGPGLLVFTEIQGLTGPDHD